MCPLPRQPFSAIASPSSYLGHLDRGEVPSLIAERCHLPIPRSRPPRHMSGRTEEKSSEICFCSIFILCAIIFLLACTRSEPERPSTERCLHIILQRGLRSLLLVAVLERFLGVLSFLHKSNSVSDSDLQGSGPAAPCSRGG